MSTNLMACDCQCSVALFHVALGWYALRGYGIS